MEKCVRLINNQNVIMKGFIVEEEYRPEPTSHTFSQSKFVGNGQTAAEEETTLRIFRIQILNEIVYD